jgi:hypothetical protein
MDGFPKRAIAKESLLFIPPLKFFINFYLSYYKLTSDKAYSISGIYLIIP